MHRSFRKGDHLYVNRPMGYAHHGIYAGRGKVIHYTGENGNKQTASVRITSLSHFLAGGEAHRVRYSKAFPAGEVVRRARSRVGEQAYNALWSNCEHFCRWAKTATDRSHQVEKGAGHTTGAGLAAGGVGAGILTVGATGAATGFSGAGVMSGLATVGGTVGGGAVAGVGVLAAAPAIAANAGLALAYQDDPNADDAERASRFAARGAGVAATAAGGVGSVAAISAAGTAGLSGAGITSGLAAIGGTVGGGMLAGTAITVAAPAALALAGAWGVYRASKLLR